MKQKHLDMYMRIVEAVAQTSEAERLKVGSIAVKDGKILAEAYNGTPRNWPTNLCEDWEGKTKPVVTHSEDNLIRKLARSTESSVGATVLCSHSCCLSCAIKLVDVGIYTFYYKDEYRTLEGIEYLLNNGVEVIKYEEEI